MKFYGQVGGSEPDATQLARRSSWDPKTGWTIEQPWRCTPGRAALMQTALLAAKIRFGMDDSDGWHIVTVFTNDPTVADGSEPSEDTEAIIENRTAWSLLGNDMERSLWARPAIIQATMNVTTFDEDLMVAIRAKIEAFLAGNSEATYLSIDSLFYDEDGETPLGITDYAATKSQILGLALALARGSDTETFSQYVLRHQFVVEIDTDLTLEFTNVNKVLTDVQMAAIAPDNLVFAVPGVAYWLKKSPTCEAVGNNKLEITQEYWSMEAYDTFVYTAAS